MQSSTQALSCKEFFSTVETNCLKAFNTERKKILAELELLNPEGGTVASEQATIVSILKTSTNLVSCLQSLEGNQNCDDGLITRLEEIQTCYNNNLYELFDQDNLEVINLLKLFLAAGTNPERFKNIKKYSDDINTQPPAEKIKLLEKIKKEAKQNLSFTKTFMKFCKSKTGFKESDITEKNAFSEEEYKIYKEKYAPKGNFLNILKWLTAGLVISSLIFATGGLAALPVLAGLGAYAVLAITPLIAIGAYSLWQFVVKPFMGCFSSKKTSPQKISAVDEAPKQSLTPTVALNQGSNEVKFESSTAQTLDTILEGNEEQEEPKNSSNSEKKESVTCTPPQEEKSEDSSQQEQKENTRRILSEKELLETTEKAIDKEEFESAMDAKNKYINKIYLKYYNKPSDPILEGWERFQKDEQNLLTAIRIDGRIEENTPTAKALENRNKYLKNNEKYTGISPEKIEQIANAEKENRKYQQKKEDRLAEHGTDAGILEFISSKRYYF